MNYRIAFAALVGIACSQPTSAQWTNTSLLNSAFSSNSDQQYPSYRNELGSSQLTIGANWTGGLTDLSLINSNIGNTAAGGFSFWQMTSPSSKRLLTYFQGNGNVGIGTAYPGARLQVEGNIRATGGSFSSIYSGNTDVLYPNNVVNAGGEAQLSIGANWTGGMTDLSLINSNLFNTSGGGFTFWQMTSSTSKRFLAYFRGDGSVGIGTTNPGQFKLAVEGKIGAQEIEVRAPGQGWADFVFKPDYVLPPLRTVETFIRQHGHLPDIPSEAVVKADGIAVGAMQSKLLQKIEELTIYVIQQQKQIDRLNSQVKRMDSPKNYRRYGSKATHPYTITR